MHHSNGKEGPGAAQIENTTLMSHGNIPESSSCRAFRDAVRDLHNMDDFEKERIGSGFYGEVYKVTANSDRFEDVAKGRNSLSGLHSHLLGYSQTDWASHGLEDQQVCG